MTDTPDLSSDPGASSQPAENVRDQPPRGARHLQPGISYTCVVKKYGKKLPHLFDAVR